MDIDSTVVIVGLDANNVVNDIESIDSLIDTVNADLLQLAEALHRTYTRFGFPATFPSL